VSNTYKKRTDRVFVGYQEKSDRSSENSD